MLLVVGEIVGAIMDFVMKLLEKVALLEENKIVSAVVGLPGSAEVGDTLPFTTVVVLLGVLRPLRAAQVWQQKRVERWHISGTMSEQPVPLSP